MFRWIYIWISKRQLADIKKAYEANWYKYGDNDHRTVHWKKRWHAVAQDVIKTLSTGHFAREE